MCLRGQDLSSRGPRAALQLSSRISVCERVDGWGQVCLEGVANMGECERRGRAHSSNRYLLSPYQVPGKVLVFMELSVQWDEKKINKSIQLILEQQGFELRGTLMYGFFPPNKHI